VYVGMYIYIKMYTFVSMYVYIYMYVRMFSMFTHTMFICVYTCVYAYVNRKGGHPSKNDQSFTYL